MLINPSLTLHHQVVEYELLDHPPPLVPPLSPSPPHEDDDQKLELAPFESVSTVAVLSTVVSLVSPSLVSPSLVSPPAPPAVVAGV